MEIKNRPQARGAFLVALLSIALLSSTVSGWPQQGVAPRPVAPLSAAEQTASSSVKVETIKEVTAALSADEMQGRGTMQPGGEKAAAYIADRFARLGLKPLGDDKTYLQSINFKAVEFGPETGLKIGDEQLKLGREFFVSAPYIDKDVSGGLVFVGYGIVSSALKRNDLAGLDVRGKMVLMMDGPPANVDKKTWEKEELEIRVLVNLIRQRAAGLIFLTGDTDPDHPFSEAADYLSRRRVMLASEDETDFPSFYPSFLSVGKQAAEKMFAGSGVSLTQALAQAESNSFAPIDLKKNASLTVRVKKSKGTSSNVVGLLEGSDPRLKEEAIVYSAHYDAYGMTDGNRIYHGAADNALGVAEMIAIAEAFAKAPVKPRRSIIFLAVTGEEYGLYGAEYWAKNPTWNIKRVAANLNFDGMGTEVYGPVKTIVGYGAEHSSLGALLNEVAAANKLKVIGDPIPSEKSFYRSDHYAFVKKGVPALMLLGAPEGDAAAWIARMKGWEKTDYHQPGDIIRPDWNWEGPRTLSRLGVVMGMRLAGSDAMPAWLSSSPFNRERGTNAPPPPEP
ncbi:MAG: M28 family peptidase [Acidobacteria bacterium]|nr:M28 family peptidase [Acidobacteriota bacterium]